MKLIATQDVWLLDTKHPYKPIVEARVQIAAGEKRTWALVPDFRKERVRQALLGASAFFTRQSAERMKLALLHKVWKNQRALNWIAPYTVAKVRDELLFYKETGTLH